MRGSRAPRKLTIRRSTYHKQAASPDGRVDQAPASAGGAVSIVLNLIIPMGSGFVAPAIPYIIRDFQVGSNGATWVVGAYTVASFAASLPLGILADMVGRNRALVAAIAVFGAGGLVCGLARSFPVLLVGRALQGVALGPLVAMALVLATENAPKGQELRLHGWRSVAAAFADFTLPPLGALLAASSWRAPFLLLALTWLMIPWSTRILGRERVSKGVEMSVYPRVFRMSLTRPAVVVVLLVGLVRFMLKYTIVFGLPLLLISEIDAWPGLAGLLLGAVSALASLVAVTTPRLATRIAPWHLMGLGCALLGTALSGIMLTSRLPWLLGGLAAYAVADGILATTQSFFVTNLAPQMVRVGFVALGGLFRNLGKALSTVLLAVLVNDVAGPAGWGVGVAIALVGALTWRFHFNVPPNGWEVSLTARQQGSSE